MQSQRILVIDISARGLTGSADSEIAGNASLFDLTLNRGLESGKVELLNAETILQRAFTLPSTTTQVPLQSDLAVSSPANTTEYAPRDQPEGEAEGTAQPELTADSARKVYGVSLADLLNPETIDLDLVESTVLILSPQLHASLNLSLPITDPKSIERVLPMEVQDLLPFDLGDFVLSYSQISALPSHSSANPIAQVGQLAPGGQEFDVHVSLAAKKELRLILDAFKGYGIDPAIVTTVPAAVGILPALLPDGFKGNCCIATLLFSGPNSNDTSVVGSCSLNLTFVVDGRVRALKIISPSGSTTSQGNLEPDQAELLAKQLEYLYSHALLEIGAVERRYRVELEAIYLLPESATSNATNNSELLRQIGQNSLHREVTLVSSSETLATLNAARTSSEESPSIIAFCAGVAAHDVTLSARAANGRFRLLTNFRVGELRYRARLKELWSGLRMIRKPLLLAAASILLALGGTYLYREHRINALQSELRTMLVEAVNLSETSAERHDRAIENMAFELDNQLKDLVSPFSLSPLEALIEISRDLPANKGVTIRGFNIKGTKLTLTGHAPDYAAIEDLDRAIRNRRAIYCRFKKNTTSGVGGRKEFTFDITLCDEQIARKAPEA